MRRIHFALDCITGQVDYKAEEKGEGPKSDRRQNDGGCGCHLLPRLRAGPISTPLVDSLGLPVGRSMKSANASIEPTLAESGADLRRSTLESRSPRMANGISLCWGHDRKVRMRCIPMLGPRPEGQVYTSC